MRNESHDIILGTGIVGWPREERIIDRYGCLYLAPSLEELELEPPITVEYPDAPIGDYGRLIAKILKLRDSKLDALFHFNSRGPITRRVGQTVILGTGILNFDQREGLNLIGVSPLDNRIEHWMGYRSVHNIHNQTVELKFRQLDTNE